jgi:hypothetical protein
MSPGGQPINIVDLLSPADLTLVRQEWPSRLSQNWAQIKADRMPTAEGKHGQSEIL